MDDKVVHVVRSDNEPVIRSLEWRTMLQNLKVRETHSVPYCPQMNGVVERYMRTMGDNLRANLRGVDHSTWEYCCQYIAWCWNRVPKLKYARAPQFNGVAPIDAVRSRRTGIIQTEEDENDQLTEKERYAMRK